MNPKHIIDVLRIAFHRQAKTPLGRWNIHSDAQTKLKIKYANEDNCGVSSSNYSGEIKESQESEELYMYMLGSESLPDSLHTKR